MKNISKFLLLLTLLPSVLLANPTKFPVVNERKLYVGAGSTEAIMTFKGKVEIENNLSESSVRSIIEDQLEHLYGPLSFAIFRAVPRGNHKISDIKITTKGEVSEASYSYSGTIVLKDGPTDKYDIILPVNPKKVYRAGMINGTNPCTDHHYQSQGDFWYFWNPDQPGCTLQKDKDYLVITTNIKRIQSPELTFPEYERLANDKGVITISLLFGMDDPENDRDPNKSQDVNAENYLNIKNALTKDGYQSTVWTKDDIKKYVKSKDKSSVYVEKLTKKFINTTTNKKSELSVLMFFGPSAMSEESTLFHLYFKDALENQSILIYDGHSGLGGHLDFDSIVRRVSPIKPNKKRYQIYYFNSCTSYSYYNTMYFDQKKSPQDLNGTKNLDILTNGLATYFSVMDDTNLVLIKSIESYITGQARISYQTIARQIDSANLFGINGDEDNPTE